MNTTTPVQDLSADQIERLLRSDPLELAPCVADSLCNFIDRIGGIENAWVATRLLTELESPR